MRLSLGSCLENVDKRWPARVRRTSQCDALESDCRGRNLRGTVLRTADSSERYLNLLTHCGGQALSIVREIEG